MIGLKKRDIKKALKAGAKARGAVSYTHLQRKADGSATTGATRPHERPATASKPSAEKMQEVKRPATATTPKASEPVKTTVIKERPLSSGASDKKATQSAQPVHRPVSYTHLDVYKRQLQDFTIWIL